MAVAIVLAGAGARGAYEAGALSVVLPELIEEETAEGDEPEIVLAGTSAGAINAAIIAAAAHEGSREVVARLERVWCTLEREDVFEVNPLRWVPYALEAATAGRLPARTYSLLDTSPLKKTIDRSEHVDWDVLRRNIGETWVKGIGLVATDVATGTGVVFVQSAAPLPDGDPRRGIEYRRVEIAGAHVRASAAIPIAFPAVDVQGQGWFSDGGTRLNTPIRPGIDLLTALGEPVKRMVIVATHPDPRTLARAGVREADPRPDIIDEGASILHSVFVDRVAEDVHGLRRLNHFMNAAGQRDARDHAGKDVHVVEHAYFGPRENGRISELARDVFRSEHLGWKPSVFNGMSRLLGGRGRSRDELLSFLFFHPSFLRALFEMGAEDARRASEGGIPWDE